MSIPLRDRIAAVSVATAVVIYALWLAGALGGLTAGWVAAIVLALGFVASASAVVPGFAALIAGSKLYLAVASLAGLVALMCGVLAVLEANEQALAVLVVLTIGLWGGATVRHTVARRPNARAIPV